MLFNTMYNLTDLWFAGLLSTESLGAVSIAGTVFFLMLSLGFGLQAGIAAVVANALGRNDQRQATMLCDSAITLGVIISLLVMVAGLTAGSGLVAILGAKDGVYELADSYLSIIFWGAPALIISFAAAGALIGYGNTSANRNALIVGFFCNLVLNPLFIFSLQLGVGGLALATVVIKSAATIYLLWVLKRYTGKLVSPKFSVASQLTLLRQVVPASATMMSIVIGSFVTVYFIGQFGSTHVAGYMVGLRLEQILLLPALGLNSAVIAITGQNFGAGLHHRVRETYLVSLKMGAFIAVVAMPVMIFLSPFLLKLFSSDSDVINTGTLYLRIDALVFFAYVVLFQSTASLQGIQQPIFPMVMGVVRHLIAPVSLYILFINIYGFSFVAVFWSLFTIVLLSAVISHLYVQARLKVLVNEQGL